MSGIQELPDVLLQQLGTKLVLLTIADIGLYLFFLILPKLSTLFQSSWTDVLHHVTCHHRPLPETHSNIWTEQDCTQESVAEEEKSLPFR